MGTILRNTWLKVSSQEFEIRAVHLPGITNRLAAYLSRWYLDVAKYSSLFAAECEDAGFIMEETVTVSCLRSIVICNFCSFTDAERLVLKEDLKRTQLNAYAPGTQKNRRSQCKSYLAFCLYFDLTPVPATAHVIALYCQFLSRSLTPQSIRNYCI